MLRVDVAALLSLPSLEMSGLQGEEAGKNVEGAQGAPRGTVRKGAVHGVLVIDKPPGPTSHDVVTRLRRALRTTRIGHAGTLDPMASGVLVMLVGEATKLAPFLTAHDKSYQALIALGTATTTLDAEGEVTEAQDVPAWLREELKVAASADVAAAREREGGLGPLDPCTPHIPRIPRIPRILAALALEGTRTEQVPPAFSAIKVGGRRSYSMARAGEPPELAARPVSVRQIRLLPHPQQQEEQQEEQHLSLEIDVSKGYYVRSLARDIGAHLGVPSHLAALRRTRSGPFTIAEAIPLDATEDALRAALQPLASAAQQSLPVAHLTSPGAQRARSGKRLDASDFTTAPPVGGGFSAWIDPEGKLVAVGLGEGSQLVVQRGFAKEEASDG